MFYDCSTWWDVQIWFWTVVQSRMAMPWVSLPQGHFLHDGLGSGVGGRLGMGYAGFPLPSTFPLASVLGPEQGSGGSGLASTVEVMGKI